MVKNRMISVFIVLIFALGVALSGIFPQDLGKKTAAGENAEEVTSLVAWSLTFYERGNLQNSVCKVEELCRDLELLEKLETAKKEKEEVEAVLDTPWAKAYCAFLEEALQDDPSKMKTTGFRLVYIDDDEVPELLIMEDNFHGAGIKVCTYYQNRVVETGEFGSMGHLRYAAGCGIINSSFTNFGEVYSDYYVLDQGEAEEIAAFHAYPDLDYEDYSVTLYEVDNETVTEALYNEKWREFENDDVYYDIDYTDGIFVENVENLKKALAQEIVALGLENPYFYPQETTVLSADIKCEGGDLWETVEGELQVKWLKKYDKGDLFRLSVFIPDDVENYLGAERKNIYFYVTPDEIYRLWSYCYDEKGRSIITFYDNDSLLMETFDTDEKLMENGELVCCMERVEDELGKEDLGENEMGTPISEIGEHFAIIPEGVRVTCSRYDTKPNGESDFYESFVWERGKGLVSYRSGFRAEAEILYMENISVKDGAQAERWYSSDNIVNFQKSVYTFDAYSDPREHISREIAVGAYSENFPKELQEILVYANDDIPDKEDEAWMEYEDIGVLAVDIDSDGEKEYMISFLDGGTAHDIRTIVARFIDGEWVEIGGHSAEGASTRALLEWENQYYLLMGDCLTYWNGGKEPDWKEHPAPGQAECWTRLIIEKKVTGYTPLEVYRLEKEAVDYLKGVDFTNLRNNNGEDIESSAWAYWKGKANRFQVKYAWTQNVEGKEYRYIVSEIVDGVDYKEDLLLTVCRQTEDERLEAAALYYLMANYEMEFLEK